MAYCFDDGPMKFWWHHTPFPQEVISHFDTGGLCMAQNSEFERHLFDYVIGNDYGFTPPKLEQWRCSMAMALASGYPAHLGAQGFALGLKVQKQVHGTRLIREYCAPNFLTEFKDGDKELMQDYCETDVEVMRQAVKCYRPLSSDEWAEFHLCCRTNEKGVPIDKAFGLAALGYAQEVADDANANIAKLTGGKMTKSTQRKSRDEWLFPKLTEYQLDLLTVYKKGEKKTSLDNDHRGYLLACDDLNADARELLEYINDAGSSALKKYAVAAHTEVAGHVHDTFLWNGAQTGRFSGRGLQPHNFRRDVYGDNEATALIEDVKANYTIDGPADTLARLLRGLIYSEEGLYYVDWSAIEGRVAPWLSVKPSGEDKLDLYRMDKDIYVVTAAAMFNRTEADVDKDLRQSGKIAELSLQFGGGANALIGMAKNYGVSFEEDEAKGIVLKWRMANPWAEEIWADYDRAISNAVRTPGEPFEVGRVTYQSDGQNFLWCELPSGRLLSYPRPKWEPYTTPWGEDRVGATFQTHHKPKAGEPPLRNHARGALLFQNSVQAVAADILREALVKADKVGLDIRLHCHDEILGVGSDGDRLNEIMLDQPVWADGLPLATGGVMTGKRWGK
ncbi:DNA polymerase [bacterium]|nr:DNA polymerase [bacterium]